MIKVGVLGARGRMGRTVCETIEDASDTELVAQVDHGDALESLLGADVIVDFTHVAVVMDNLRWCVEHDLNVVVGTSGFSDERLAEVRSWTGKAPDVRVLIVPNFSIGAVLMMSFAAQAARFFESAEIIELHHNRKMDAPSGTALRTAALMGEARAKAGLAAPADATEKELDGARGTIVDDIHVHSVRMAGLLAHHEILFGGHGEILTVRHDSMDRASFMPGVLVGIRGIRTLPPGLTVGLEPLLGLASLGEGGTEGVRVLERPDNRQDFRTGKDFGSDRVDVRVRHRVDRG
jgi:4-hydroxy-tetrahydrodipicolinate reductase